MLKIPGIGKATGMALGAVFCLSLLSFAAGGPGPGWKKGWHEGERIIQMKDKLGLSDAQVAKIKKLLKDSRRSIEDLKDQQDENIQAVEAKLKAKASDTELKTLLDALDANHQKIGEVRKNTMDQLRTILTPTQQAKAIVDHGERPDNWKDRPGPCPKHKDKKAAYDD